MRASLGDTYGQFWGHDYIYDDEGNRVVGDNGYWLQTPNLVPMGSVLPDYTLGIRNSFRILNAIDISVLFDIQQGGKFYSLSHMWGMYSGMLEETAGVNDKGNEIRDPVSEGGGIKLDGVTEEVTFDEDGNYIIWSELNNWDQTHYENGVRASMEKWGVPAAEIDAYIAALPPASEETVLTQKYIALYMDPHTAWAEYRRTGYPQTLVKPYTDFSLTVPATGDVRNFEFVPLIETDDIPARMRYPQFEQTLNGTIRKAAVDRMGADAITTKLWWDVN